MRCEQTATVLVKGNKGTGEFLTQARYSIELTRKAEQNVGLCCTRSVRNKSLSMNPIAELSVSRNVEMSVDADRLLIGTRVQYETESSFKRRSQCSLGRASLSRTRLGVNDTTVLRTNVTWCRPFVEYRLRVHIITHTKNPVELYL